MGLREPLFVSVVTALATAVPVALASPAGAASTPSAPTIVDVVPSTATVRTGSTFTLKVIAENEKKSKSAAHALNFVISKSTSPTGARKVGSGTVPSIAAKTRKTFTFKVPIPSNADAGSFRLLLCHPRTGKPLLCHNDNVKLTVLLAPAKLTISPTSHDFGAVATNVGELKRFTVRNVGRRWSGAVAVSLSGGQASSFSFLGYNCGPSLAPNATCTIDPTFEPNTTGLLQTTLKVTPSATGSTGAKASLKGTGVNPAQLSLSSANDFGGVTVGSSSAKQTLTVTNSGAQPSGPISSSFTGTNVGDFSLSDDTCTGVALAIGASCTFKVQFDPQDLGDRSATLVVSANPGDVATASLTGAGLAPAGLTSSSVTTFDPTVTGSSTPYKTVTITNVGGSPSGTIATSLVLSGADQFNISDDQCNGQILAAGASCTVKVRFSPTTAGLKAASLKAEANPGDATEASLQGTGLAPANLTSSSVDDFGSVATGASSPQKTVTYTNSGGVATGPIATSIVGGSANQFSKSDDTCNGVSLAAGASCTVKVEFDPTNQGLQVGALRAEATPGGSAEAPLSGTGAAPAALSLSPGSLNFDDQEVGTSSVKTLTLKNTGGVPTGADLDFYFNGAGFAIDGATTNCTSAGLAAGATCTIGVRFEPDDVDSFGGIVVAVAYPPGPVSVNVGGNGINPPI